MNKKINLNFLIISFTLIIIITLTILYVFKKSNEKQALYNAQMVSNVIESSLTNYMEQNKVHEIDQFLGSLTNIKDLDQIWLVRSESINKQFGDKKMNLPKDDIDKKALETGIAQYEVHEDISKSTMRITIPYKAVWNNKIDCKKCHDVNYGDTLGAISVEMNLNEIKNIGFSSIYFIPLIVLVGLLIIMFIFNSISKQYLTIFENLAESLNSVINGRFKKIPYPTNITAETISLIDKFNSLITTFKDTSMYIDKKLKGFIGNSTENKDISPFEASKEIITNLSNLYQFKKEIELDNTREEIYDRLTTVFLNQFGLKNFTIMQINYTTNKLEIIKEIGNSFYCKHHIGENPQDCRAARTKNDVVSIEYHHTCPYFKKEDKFHYCVTTNIGKNVYLIVNFVFDTNEELEKLKDNISFVKNYINESAPSIEVKLLMDALQQSAFKDGLTSLYNRKFLEEHTKKLIPQARRQGINIGVLLLDMDHFKAVNDEYGHDIGDKVLKELARILTENVRESDIVIRYGGEEFMILLVGVNSAQDALDVANKIRVKVSENEIDVYAGAKLRKTISIGLAMFPDDSTNLESVIKNADIALYEAKNKGRNQVIRFTPEQVTSVELF